MEQENFFAPAKIETPKNSPH